MSEFMTLSDLRDAIRSIDICMMTTRSDSGMLHSRPMSTNKDIDYAGNAYFFTLESTGAAHDLERNPEICLSFQGRPDIFSKKFYVCISGDAELIRDRGTMEQHWVKDLDVWFENGIDTPGIVMIRTQAKHITYWHGMHEGEFMPDISGSPQKQAA